MQPDVLAASLNMQSEEIRTASVWYLVHAYVPDPTMMAPRVRTILGTPTEEASTREAFGRELLRRMLGGEKKDDPRWLEWLQTSEADPLLATDEALFQHFTDKEFLVRKNHCGITSYDCRMPERRSSARVIPSTDVAESAFFLPELLPPGVAAAVDAGTRCNGFWLGLAGATSDLAGRVQTVTIKRIQMDNACDKAVTTLIRLSLATPASLDVPMETNNVLLVHGFRQPPCLDEGPLEVLNGAPRYAGGEITSPIVKRRIEPQFPLAARRAMAGSAMVTVVLRCIISRDGCVRSVQLVRQSPYPDMNGAALMAISQWTFEPGRLRGVPVDVIFLLTVNFRTN
jgi:TonB family protein